jgi:hypothetical protein
MPEDRPGPPPGSAEEALRRLEERLDRASAAAERLMAEAAEAAAGGSPSADRRSAGNPPSGNPPSGNPSAGNPPSGNPPSGNPSAGNPSAGADPGKPPPAGWQVPEDVSDAARDPDPLVALAQALRDLVPPDLQRRLVAAIRELLLALRALIDWYLERLERRRGQAVEVQDIPIL